MIENNLPQKGDEEIFSEQLLQIKNTTDETMEKTGAVLDTVDFSYISKIREDYISNITPALSAMANTFAQYREISKRIGEVLDPFVGYLKRIPDITAQIAEALKPLLRVSIQYNAIDKLAHSQLIWFDYLDDKLANDILANGNIENIITQHLEDTDYFGINKIVKESRKSTFLKEKKLLYSQSEDAYRKKHYDLACVGFISVIDFLLSKTSGDISTSGKKHIEIILVKLKTDEVLDQFEFTLFAALLSFEVVSQSLFGFSDFRQEEPNILNRHWIAHGRTQKEYTKLDCVKLINYIYALLLIGSVQDGELNE